MELVKLPNYQSLDPVEFLYECLVSEAARRQTRKVATQIKKSACFYPDACIENTLYAPDRNLNRGLIERLAGCDWIRNGEHCVITGATGSGKTWLASALMNALLLRKVYRKVGAASGENVNLTHIAEVLDIGRPFVKHCLETLERLCLVDRVPVWPGTLTFDRGVRSPKYVIVDSGWLCGLLGFCSTAPSVISSDHPEVVRQLLTNWTWAQLATLTDNDPDLHLWHFALRTGLIIDLILEDANTGSLTAFQISTKENVTESDFTSLVKFRDLVKDREVQNVLLYCGQSLRRFDSIGTAVPLAFLWL